MRVDEVFLPELQAEDDPGDQEGDDDPAEVPGQHRVEPGREAVDGLVHEQREDEEDDGSGHLGGLADEHLDERLGPVPEAGRGWGCT